MTSLFGGGARSAAPQGAPDQARLAEAAMELEAVSDLFTRIVSSCHQKCISTRYAEPELNKGESVCVDRSVLVPLSLSLSLWGQSSSNGAEQHPRGALARAAEPHADAVDLPPSTPSFSRLDSSRSCVAKYFAVNEKVQERLQAAQAGGARVGM